MRIVASIFAVVLFICPTIYAMSPDEPVMLLGTIVKWQYPDSKINGAEMSDAATVDASGKRTVPSVLLKTTMTTKDTVEDILMFYRTLLTRDLKFNDKLGAEQNTSRSVIFNDESNGCSFAFHTIIVNTSKTSTTIIVTRGTEENETRITWKQYLRLEIGG